MPNWSPEEYDDDDTSHLTIAPKTITAPKSTLRAPTIASTPSPSSPLCKHIWRACSGKFGAYWWCPECKKTKGIYVCNKKGEVTEDTALQWFNNRNADSTERHNQLTLAKTNQTKRRK